MQELFEGYIESGGEHTGKLADQWDLDQMKTEYKDTTYYVDDLERFYRAYNKDSTLTLFHLKAMMQYQQGSSTINRFSALSSEEIYDEANDGSFLIQTIRALDSAILFNGIINKDEEISLYRGIPSNLYGAIYEAYQNNEPYINQPFMSTSDSMQSC